MNTFFEQIFNEAHFSEIKRKTQEDFIEQARQLHPEYDYSKVNYVNTASKVIISCPKHGEFSMTPDNFLRGQGCPKCGRELRSSNTDEFIERARQLHPEYDYSKVNYVNSKEKVIISCPKHGEFSMTPNSFLNGHSCPKCSESKGEGIIRNWLEKHRFDYECQCRLQGLKQYPYDFYLPKYNLLIEYNGEQHYKEVPVFHRKNGDFEGQLMRDHIKKDYAEKNGYDLLVIPYWEFKNIDKILLEKLLHVG